MRITQVATLLPLYIEIAIAMKKLFCLPLLALPLALLPMTSAFADTMSSESRAIDSKVQKILLNGVVSVTIKQGATASLMVYAENKQLGYIVTEQHGEVLRIGSKRPRGDQTKLRAEITLPQLQEFVAAGVGKSDLSGFSGETMRLDLKGAGAVSFQGSYKTVQSSLTGVGSLALNLSNTDNTEFKLSGLGSAVFKGQSKKLHANLSGLGSMDAEHFNVDTLDLRLKGMGSATAFAKQTANVNLAGMGSATIYGNPTTRNGNRSGMGSISWKE